MRPANLGDTSTDSSSTSDERGLMRYSFPLRSRNSAQKSPTQKTKQPTARKRTGGLSKNYHDNIPSTSRRAQELSQRQKNTSTNVSQRPKRKQRNPQSYAAQQRNFMKEVRTLCKRTDNMVPRLPFGRLVREIMMSCGNYTSPLRITVLALQALQEATEMYITQILSDAYLLSLHRGRVTLTSKDIQLLMFLLPLQRDF